MVKICESCGKRYLDLTGRNIVCPSCKATGGPEIMGWAVVAFGILIILLLIALSQG